MVLAAVDALEVLVERSRVLGPHRLDEARAIGLEAGARDVGARARHPPEQGERLTLHLLEALDLGGRCDSGAVASTRRRARRREPRREVGVAHRVGQQLEPVADEFAADVHIRVHLHAVDDLMRVLALEVGPERVAGVGPRDGVNAGRRALEPLECRIGAPHVRHAEERHRVGGDGMIDLGDARRRQQRRAVGDAEREEGEGHGGRRSSLQGSGATSRRVRVGRDPTSPLAPAGAVYNVP